VFEDDESGIIEKSTIAEPYRTFTTRILSAEIPRNEDMEFVRVAVLPLEKKALMSMSNLS